jgi:uncharacterized SAM-binding protein YcdF (DUF218 family)
VAAGRRRRRRATWARRAALALALTLSAWLAGLFWFAGRIPGPGPTDTAVTDAIAVPTGGSGRLQAGLDLLAAGRAEKLFVSGVYRGVEVAELLRLSARAPDRLRCCVVLGYSADNTAGNARETAEWMSREGYSSLRLVTASYHMPRSLLEFRRAMPGVTIIAHPVFPGHVKQGDWWRWPGTARLIVGEYNKYLLALVAHAFTASPGREG